MRLALEDLLEVREFLMDLTNQNQTKSNVEKNTRRYYCSPGLFLSVYDTQLSTVAQSVFHRDTDDTPSHAHAHTHALVHTHPPCRTLGEMGLRDTVLSVGAADKAVAL